MRIQFPTLFISLLIIGFLSTNLSLGQNTENLYGRPQQEVFRDNRVKEVLIEQEQYYQGRPSIPKHPEQRLVIDKNGYILRRETASTSTQQFTHRHDMTYDEKGNTLTFTSFIRRNEANSTSSEKITPSETEWVPSSRYRYLKIGKEKQGSDNWNPEIGKWEINTKIRTYIKNDTLYTETRDAKNELKEINRSYSLKNNKNVNRLDFLTFSPKGLSTVKYYYHKTEKGRLVETGEVDFEAETMAYFEKHPKSQLKLFGSKNEYNHLFDAVARLYPGTLEPNTTYTYNENGQLIEKTEYDTHITFQRGQEGQVQIQREVYSDNSGRVITYFFNEKGLVEKEVRVYLKGQPEENRFYTYTFY